MESTQDNWLLEPFSHTTNPIQKEDITVSADNLRKDLAVQLHHPHAPHNRGLESEIVLCASGWTEPKLEKQARALARVGLHSACFNHPRSGALSDFMKLLVASRSLRANWQELSSSIWEEHDLERAEHVLKDILADQVADNDDRKKLIKSAISAGRTRRDNVHATVEELSELGYKVHLLGHSLGGVDVSMATKMSPQNIGSLTLAGPGGLMLQDSVVSIIPRVARTVIKERGEFLANARDLARMALNSVIFIAENPVLTLYEGGYAATSRLEKILWDIVADYKIPSVLVLGEYDTMFPTDIVTKDSKAIPFAGKVILPKAGHNMTTHQTSEMATIMGNIVLDTLNRRSGRLEANTNNLIAVRKSMRPVAVEITQCDVDRELLSRND